MDKVAMWTRASLSGLLLLLTVWWLYVVANHLSVAPQTNESGEVVLDTFQRAKDILLVVLPLLTTALGYWFGAAGKEKAEQKAEAAQSELLDVAKRANPQAFGLPAQGGG